MVFGQSGSSGDPDCHRTILFLCNGETTAVATMNRIGLRGVRLRRLFHPTGAVRPVAPEVPSHLAEDYRQAVATLLDSPKASAALSRRCLQQLIRDHTSSARKSLWEEIEEVLAQGILPSHLSEQLHAVREIGNFAAHTTKSTNSGLIVDVEPEEAEWNLDVLDGLFEFLYVAPASAQRRKDRLNRKLGEVGKKPLP